MLNSLFLASEQLEKMGVNLNIIPDGMSMRNATKGINAFLLKLDFKNDKTVIKSIDMMSEEEVKNNFNDQNGFVSWGRSNDGQFPFSKFSCLAKKAKDKKPSKEDLLELFEQKPDILVKFKNRFKKLVLRGNEQAKKIPSLNNYPTFQKMMNLLNSMTPDSFVNQIVNLINRNEDAINIFYGTNVYVAFELCGQNDIRFFSDEMNNIFIMEAEKQENSSCSEDLDMFGGDLFEYDHPFDNVKLSGFGSKSTIKIQSMSETTGPHRHRYGRSENNIFKIGIKNKKRMRATAQFLCSMENKGRTNSVINGNGKKDKSIAVIAFGIDAETPPLTTALFEENGWGDSYTSDEQLSEKDNFLYLAEDFQKAIVTGSEYSPAQKLKIIIIEPHNECDFRQIMSLDCEVDHLLKKAKQWTKDCKPPEGYGPLAFNIKREIYSVDYSIFPANFSKLIGSVFTSNRGKMERTNQYISSQAIAGYKLFFQEMTNREIKKIIRKINKTHKELVLKDKGFQKRQYYHTALLLYRRSDPMTEIQDTLSFQIGLALNNSNPLHQFHILNRQEKDINGDHIGVSFLKQTEKNPKRFLNFMKKISSLYIPYFEKNILNKKGELNKYEQRAKNAYYDYKRAIDSIVQSFGAELSLPQKWTEEEKLALFLGYSSRTINKKFKENNNEKE